MSKPFWPLLFALSLLASAAFAGDFVIVPGQRIGTVTLGMDHASVRTLLHAPSTTHQAHGLILDTWLSHRLLTTNPTGERGLKRDHLTVFFRRDHAVQIEVSSPRFKTKTGLSASSSVADFAQGYPHFAEPHFPSRYENPFPGFEYFLGAEGMPAPKHFVFYGDAVKRGIAWKYDAWGALAPEPGEGQQEAVIVHLPGQKVMLNPNDGLPYSGTGQARK